MEHSALLTPRAGLASLLEQDKRAGLFLESEKLRALSNFYREEFERHLERLHAEGGLGDCGGVDRACRRLIDDLDRVCCKSGFPAVAETLLERFETLTRLSETDPRRGH